MHRKDYAHPDQLELGLDVVPAEPAAAPKVRKAAHQGRPYPPFPFPQNQQRPHVVVRRAGFRPDACGHRRE